MKPTIRRKRALPDGQGRRILPLLAAALCAVGVTLGGCDRAAPEPRAVFPPDSSVLLVTIDTLRPDALGFVAGRNETPNIDALAAGGVRFAAAVSSVPLTLPSHTTMMTGVQPVRHGIHVNGQVLAASVPTLAEQFRAHGHATAAFVSATVLKKEFGLDRGFDLYDDAGTPLPDRLLQRRAVQTIAAARAWIEAHRGQRWFVWVHVYDAHMPYDPPRTFWKPGERGAYDGAVTYVDDALAPLFDAARGNAGSNLLTILTADHGEAFGEHEEIQHGIFIYETTMRVPLVISFPGILPPAAPSFVPRLVDLAPTLAGGFGWEPPLAFDGIDLTPGLLGKPLEVPPAYIESEFPWTAYGWAPLHGIYEGDWKFIAAPDEELYALGDDAGEQRNLAAGNLRQVARMTARLDRTRLAPPLAEAGRIDDAETLERLQSLGYVGAGNTLGPPPEGRPDPKTRTRTREQLRAAEALMQQGETDEALAKFAEALADDPENRFALMRSGSLALQRGDLPLAIEHLRAVLAQSSEQGDAQFALADALTRSRRYGEALPHWLEAVRLQPKKVEAWSNLGSTAIWAGDTGRAIRAYRSALELAPNDAAILGNLGEAERAAGNLADAVAHLTAAAEREGASTRRASRIGLLHADIGNAQAAMAWLARARESDDDFAAGQVRRAAYLVAGDIAAARLAVGRACRADPAVAAKVQADTGLRAVATACSSARR